MTDTTQPLRCGSTHYESTIYGFRLPPRTQVVNSPEFVCDLPYGHDGDHQQSVPGSDMPYFKWPRSKWLGRSDD